MSTSKSALTQRYPSHSRFLKKYLQKETESLQSGKANVSAITQANRRKKMQENSSLIKYFVRCANKREARVT